MLTEKFNVNIMVYEDENGKKDYVMDVIPRMNLGTICCLDNNDVSEIKKGVRQLLDEWVKEA